MCSAEPCDCSSECKSESRPGQRNTWFIKMGQYANTHSAHFPPALIAASAMTFTDPSQWPGFSDQPVCVRDRFTISNQPDVIKTLFGCGDWACVCNHYCVAVPTLSSYVSVCESEVYTLNNPADISAASSLFYWFCSQLSGVTDITAPFTGSVTYMCAPPVSPASSEVVSSVFSSSISTYSSPTPSFIGSPPTMTGLSIVELCLST